MSITQDLREEGLYKQLWKLCAGPLIDMPQVGERVFYFPQGHLEQVEFLTNQEFDQGMLPHFNLPSQILCRVLNIQLSAEPETDEVYASITLLPEFETNPRVPDPTPPETHRQEMHSFCKTLTGFDTSIHEGFLVLQNHDAMCLPQLDMTQTTPTQELVVRDLHGFEWKFRHIYSDQLRTHLLTSGWSNFVSSKRLNTGDAFIFLRGPNDKDLWCGVKHLTRQQSPIHSSMTSSQYMHLAVLSATSHAVMSGTMFIVNYKPRISQFIIRLNKYLEAMSNNFFVGMPFKMRFEGEDSSLDILSFSGTIVGAGDFSPAWPLSTWRSLQVNWDELSTIPRPQRVSPWEIEPFATFASLSISRSTREKNIRFRPTNIPPSGNANNSSRMRVDGICSSSPLLRASSSFSYKARNNKASASTQAFVSGYASVSRKLNNGQYDQVENEEKSGNYKNI